MAHFLELIVELLAAFAPGGPNFMRAVRNTCLGLAVLMLSIAIVTALVAGGHLGFMDSRKW